MLSISCHYYLYTNTLIYTTSIILTVLILFIALMDRSLKKYKKHWIKSSLYTCIYFVIYNCLYASLFSGIYELKELGYSLGGYPSSQFCLLEGDTLLLQFSGDITAKPLSSEKVQFLDTFCVRFKFVHQVMFSWYMDGKTVFPMFQYFLTSNKMINARHITVRNNWNFVSKYI